MSSRASVAASRLAVRRAATAIALRSPVAVGAGRSAAAVAPRVARRAMASSAASATSEQPNMFCFQCEQTEGGSGCTTIGVCGKTPETASLQDLLVHQLKGISRFNSRLHQMGKPSAEIDAFVLRALFSTLTNVNFDSDRFVAFCKEADAMLKNAEQLYRKAGGTDQIDTSSFQLGANTSLGALEDLGRKRGSVWARRQELGEDIAGLMELVTYGIKGAAAYHEHNLEMSGKTNPEIMKAIATGLDFLAAPPKGGYTAGDLTTLALKIGEANLSVMANLEQAHLSQFGTPSPKKVEIMPSKGKCILISGHDLVDLKALLEQTEGKGIDVYTHGEMLPGHGYPELNKHKHLKGNYGGAWQLQKFDFATFPGPIIMTSNCLIEPRKSYKERIYTRGVVGWPGVKHLKDRDFSGVINQALSLPGFDKDSSVQRHVTTGFGKDAVLGAAGAIVENVKAGNIKHFFFIGGCDGAEGERNYFKELALAAPKESVILTAGCGKYRFNKHDLGTIPGNSGIPRMIDMGQCNDSYGAVVVALALKDAFGAKSVNDLPLSFAVSWFEQKAVAVLLTLLHLGVKNIHLGPALPAFVSPAVLNVLIQNFGIKPINSNIHGELHSMMVDEQRR